MAQSSPLRARRIILSIAMPRIYKGHRCTVFPSTESFALGLYSVWPWLVAT
jgi:hypothetical protein